MEEIEYTSDADVFLNKTEILFKFIVIGDFGVGKSYIYISLKVAYYTYFYLQAKLL